MVTLNVIHWFVPNQEFHDFFERFEIMSKNLNIHIKKFFQVCQSLKTSTQTSWAPVLDRQKWNCQKYWWKKCARKRALPECRSPGRRWERCPDWWGQPWSEGGNRLGPVAALSSRPRRPKGCRGWRAKRAQADARPFSNQALLDLLRKPDPEYRYKKMVHKIENES